MTRRQFTWTVLALVWAAVGAAIAWSSLGGVNPDARVFVGIASVLGPGLALAAAVMTRRGRYRTAGLLLAASAVVTPTYFAYPLSAVALIAGLTLAVFPMLAAGPADVAASP